MDIPKLIAVLVLATVTACSDPASAPASSASTSADTYYSRKPCPESAQQFWTKFRAAVLKDDFNAVASMTHFPLEVYTSTNDFSERLLYRNNFNKHFAYLLNLGLGGEFDPYPKPAPTSMKEFARAVSKIDACTDRGTRFQMGMWMFRMYPAGFRFTGVAPNDF